MIIVTSFALSTYVSVYFEVFFDRFVEITHMTTYLEPKNKYEPAAKDKC